MQWRSQDFSSSEADQFLNNSGLVFSQPMHNIICIKYLLPQIDSYKVLILTFLNILYFYFF
jgi:hypothetical protein